MAQTENTHMTDDQLFDAWENKTIDYRTFREGIYRNATEYEMEKFIEMLPYSLFRDINTELIEAEQERRKKAN